MAGCVLSESSAGGGLKFPHPRGLPSDPCHGRGKGPGEGTGGLPAGPQPVPLRPGQQGRQDIQNPARHVHVHQGRLPRSGVRLVQTSNPNPIIVRQTTKPLHGTPCATPKTSCTHSSPPPKPSGTTCHTGLKQMDFQGPISRKHLSMDAPRNTLQKVARCMCRTQKKGMGPASD